MTTADSDSVDIVSKTPKITRLVVKLFGWRINSVASRILGRAYERGHINSQQYHVLARQFDPTQTGVFGLLNGRGRR